MSGNCDLCGVWCGKLIEGLCVCCQKVPIQEHGARLAVAKALTNPATTMKELKTLADLARVSIVAVCD